MTKNNCDMWFGQIEWFDYRVNHKGLISKVYAPDGTKHLEKLVVYDGRVVGSEAKYDENGLPVLFLYRKGTVSGVFTLSSASLSLRRRWLPFVSSCEHKHSLILQMLDNDLVGELSEQEELLSELEDFKLVVTKLSAAWMKLKPERAKALFFENYKDFSPRQKIYYLKIFADSLVPTSLWESCIESFPACHEKECMELFTLLIEHHTALENLLLVWPASPVVISSVFYCLRDGLGEFYSESDLTAFFSWLLSHVSDMQLEARLCLCALSTESFFFEKAKSIRLYEVLFSSWRLNEYQSYHLVSTLFHSPGLSEEFLQLPISQAVHEDVFSENTSKPERHEIDDDFLWDAIFLERIRIQWMWRVFFERASVSWPVSGAVEEAFEGCIEGLALSGEWQEVFNCSLQALYSFPQNEFLQRHLVLSASQVYQARGLSLIRILLFRVGFKDDDSCSRFLSAFLPHREKHFIDFERIVIGGSFDEEDAKNLGLIADLVKRLEEEARWKASFRSRPVELAPLTSVTEVAQFVFCPVSYSIQRSVELSPSLEAKWGFHYRTLLT